MRIRARIYMREYNFILYYIIIMLSTSTENLAKYAGLIVKSKQKSPAELIYSHLNGVFAIYKPPDTTHIDLVRKLKYTFVKGIKYSKLFILLLLWLLNILSCIV